MQPDEFAQLLRTELPRLLREEVLYHPARSKSPSHLRSINFRILAGFAVHDRVIFQRQGIAPGSFRIPSGRRNPRHSSRSLR